MANKFSMEDEIVKQEEVKKKEKVLYTFNELHNVLDEEEDDYKEHEEHKLII